MLLASTAGRSASAATTRTTRMARSSTRPWHRHWHAVLDRTDNEQRVKQRMLLSHIKMRQHGSVNRGMHEIRSLPETRSGAFERIQILVSGWGLLEEGLLGVISE